MCFDCNKGMLVSEVLEGTTVVQRSQTLASVILPCVSLLSRSTEQPEVPEPADFIGVWRNAVFSYHVAILQC